MNYKKIYDDVIIRAKLRNAIIGYKEKHHIIPRCVGGKDVSDNIVELTPEEHFLCHQLLSKIYPNDRGLIHAAFVMGLNSNGQRPNSKLYGWILRKYSEAKRYKRIIVHCAICNNEIENLIGSKRPSKKYCSIKCSIESKKDALRKIACIVI